VLSAFTQFEILLRLEGTLTGWLGHLLHGMLFAQLAQVDPLLAGHLHAQKRKPFSLWYQEREGLILLHVSTWDEALGVALPGAFPPGNFARLSRTRAEILSCSQKEPPSERQAALEQFRLCFLSPACFRSSGRTLLFPEGRLIVESLSRASGLPMPDVPDQCLRPLRYALKTEEVLFGPYVLTGFVGWCEYSAVAAPELQALLRVMPYTGIGYKTAQGMGAVQVRPVK